MANKNWLAHTNSTLKNKTLLIIGYGNNGISLAKKARSFNMKKIITVKRKI